jgi:MFS family permease
LKNKKALTLLFTANAISGFAQGISMLAIPWYFADVLNDSASFGIIYSFTTLATLFWGLYSGTLIDRFPRKNIFLALCTFSFLILSTVASIGFYLGELPTILVALVFCATIFNYNMHYPNLYAFGQEITEKENYGKTNSLIEIIGQSTSVLSGAFAAILLTGVNQELLNSIGLNNFTLDITPWKLHEIFLLDAFTYVIAFSLIWFIKYTPVKPKVVDTGDILTRLKQGVSFLKKYPLLLYFGMSSFAIFIVVLIHIHQLMPIYINNHLHASGGVYAIAEMTCAFGALLSGIGIRWVFKNTNSVKAIIILMTTSIIMFELLVFTKSPYVLSFVCFVLGISNAGARILRITYLFNHIPNHIIGRTGSVFQSLNILFRFILISIFALPFFGEENNIIWTYVIGGSFILISILPLAIFYKKLISFKIDEE